MSKKENTGSEVAVKQSTALATADDFDVSAYAGAGMESADADSFAVPFAMILQKGSPQVDEASGQALEGAKAGMIYDNISQSMTDGKEGILVVPCSFRRVFIRWGAENGNESFKGEYTPEQVAEMKERGELKELDNRLYFPLADGTVHEKKCDRMTDTRNHYVLVVDPATGDARPALVSMSSTQIKKSKGWMADMNNIRFDNPATGARFQPPTFATMYKLTTIPEQNDKGTWYGWRFERAGRASQQHFELGKSFYQTVKKGDVQAKYEAPHSAESGGQTDNAM